MKTSTNISWILNQASKILKYFVFSAVQQCLILEIFLLPRNSNSCLLVISLLKLETTFVSTSELNQRIKYSDALGVPYPTTESVSIINKL